MEGVVNIVGVITALTCSILLYRGYRRSGARLLCWGAACFLGLAFESAAIFVDRIVLPEISLIVYRQVIAIVGIGLLIFGLIWETQ
jgi:hypothetical protein